MKAQKPGIWKIVLLQLLISLNGSGADTSGALTWQVTQRDFHSEAWEASVPVVDTVNGKMRFERHNFVSLESGMNFVDETGTWRRTREEYQVTPDGYAIAR